MTSQTIGDRIDSIRRLYPRGPNRYGQLYRTQVNARRMFRKVTLYTLFVSEDSSYLIRDHLFESKKQKRSPQQWSEWFGRNLTEIHQKGVLPGMSLRTGGKAWSVLKIIGWVGDARTSSTIPKRRRTRVKRRTPRANRSKSMAVKRRVRKH